MRITPEMVETLSNDLVKNSKLKGREQALEDFVSGTGLSKKELSQLTDEIYMIVKQMPSTQLLGLAFPTILYHIVYVVIILSLKLCRAALEIEKLESESDFI